jgi:hypothetical protein
MKKMLFMLLFISKYIIASNQIALKNFDFLKLGIEKTTKETLEKTLYSEKSYHDIYDTFIMGMLKENNILPNINRSLKAIILHQLLKKEMDKELISQCIATVIQTIGKCLLLSIKIDFEQIIKKKKITESDISINLQLFMKRFLKLEKTEDIKEFFHLCYNLLTIEKFKITYAEKKKELLELNKKITENKTKLENKKLLDVIFNPFETAKELYHFKSAKAKERSLLKNKPKELYFNQLIIGTKIDTILFDLMKDIAEELAENYNRGTEFNETPKIIHNITLKFLKYFIKNLTENSSIYTERIFFPMLERTELGTNLLFSILGLNDKYLYEENQSLVKNNELDKIVYMMKNISEFAITKKKFSIYKEKDKNSLKAPFKEINKHIESKKNKIETNDFYIEVLEALAFLMNKFAEMLVDTKINTNKESRKSIKKFLEKLISETKQREIKKYTMNEITAAEEKIQYAISENNQEKILKELNKLKEKNQSKELPLFGSFGLAAIYSIATSQLSERLGKETGKIIQKLSRPLFNSEKIKEKNNLQLKEISSYYERLENQRYHEGKPERGMLEEA